MKKCLKCGTAVSDFVFTCPNCEYKFERPVHAKEAISKQRRREKAFDDFIKIITVIDVVLYFLGCIVFSIFARSVIVIILVVPSLVCRILMTLYLFVKIDTKEKTSKLFRLGAIFLLSPFVAFIVWASDT